MELGHTIAILRQRHNLSQKELSKKLNVSTSSIGLWETNKRLPSIDKFVEIADYFSVSADFLLQNDRKVAPEDFITNIDTITPKKHASLTQADEQANLIRESFLKLSESNKYILMGKAMELLKEENKTTKPVPQEKRA